MQVIHSFWSKAYFHGRWGQESKIHMDLYSFALSYHYAKVMYGKISLVTDPEGLTLFSCIPYNDISLVLTNLDHVNSGFWTAGKIKALQVQTKPCLHIDGDVFLMGKEIKAILKSNWDVAVQMREVGEHYNSTYPQIFQNLQRVWPQIKDLSVFNYAYNNGILGFQDIDLKNEYAIEYFHLLAELDAAQIKFPPKADPNVVVEQSLLTRIASYKNSHVKELITLDDMEKFGLFEYSEKIGFVHLWGNSKYQKNWHKKVKAKLKAENPKLYRSVNEMVKSL